LRGKIRAIVQDPQIAELLTPHGYPLGSKRPAVGNGFYETFNRSNVTLVDISERGLERFTPNGLEVGGTEIPLDIVVFATGFDAYTGALTSVDLRGRRGLKITDKWINGPRTYLGITIAGFPNLFAIGGPHSPAANNPPCSEAQADWIAETIGWMRENDLSYIEPTAEAEEEWVALATDLATHTLAPYGEKVRAWALGANIPGKAHAIQNFTGPLPDYIAYCEAALAGHFQGFELRRESRGRDAAGTQEHEWPVEAVALSGDIVDTESNHHVVKQP